METPQTPQHGNPTDHDAENPQTPQQGNPTGPDAETTRTPHQVNPPGPDAENPRTPQQGNPTGPDQETTQTPQQGNPTGPDQETTRTPQQGNPTGTDAGNLRTPQQGNPTGPDVENPRTPQQGNPTGPDVENPRTPHQGNPPGPEVNPRTPQQGNPTVPEIDSPAVTVGSHRVIELRDYRVICSESNYLGKGGFGTVWKGGHKTITNLEVAVKTVDRRKCSGRLIERETGFARTLMSNEPTCRNIVKFYAVENQQHFMYLVVELCSMNLNTVFKIAKSKVPFAKVSQYMGDMAAGVQYLHKLKICHRDLKPANILEKEDCLKISDLGLARDIPEGSSTRPSVTGGVGTRGWLAPEVYLTGRRAYHLPVDVFSLALIFLAMLGHEVGKFLIPHMEADLSLGDWMRAVGSAGYPVRVPDLRIPRGDELVTQTLDLIREMICFQPDDRIRIADICRRIQEIRDIVVPPGHPAEPVPQISQQPASATLPSTTPSSANATLLSTIPSSASATLPSTTPSSVSATLPSTTPSSASATLPSTTPSSASATVPPTTPSSASTTVPAITPSSASTTVPPTTPSSASAASAILPSFPDPFSRKPAQSTSTSEPAMGQGAGRSPFFSRSVRRRCRSRAFLDPQESISRKSCQPLTDRIEAMLYGNCIGDAIGLLTEFMSQPEAENIYGKHRGQLEFKHKIHDAHRSGWVEGDWTHSSDHMLLIMRSLVESMGQVDQRNLARKLKHWACYGFPELGDSEGFGIGLTTSEVLAHKMCDTNPEKAALAVWLNSKCDVAPNGGVMRTAAVAAFRFHDLDVVVENALTFCRVTHADPRCQASCVAVVTTLALMLQGKHMRDDGLFDVDAITDASYQRALECLDPADSQEYKRNVDEIKYHMYAEHIEDLKLDENGKIGYTLKCLGAGFWALRQDDFRLAIEEITFAGGDSCSNGAIAGALLGCKLGKKGLTASWLETLANKQWLQKEIDQFLRLVLAFSGEYCRSRPPPKLPKRKTDENAAM